LPEYLLFRLSVNPFVFSLLFGFMFEPLINIDSGCNSKARQKAQILGTDESAAGKSLLRINLKERPANWPKPAFGSSQNWLARTSPRVLQWYVLCGIPYRGTGATCLTLPYEPASLPNRVSYPEIRAAPEAPLLICNFPRVSPIPLDCKSVT